MLFYFSATGNSLYVAKQLEKEENLVSIPQIINQDNLVFEDERIGIVCPVFGHLPPAMVTEFLKKATFKTEYFYVILTYGNRHGGASKLVDDLLINECDKKANYIHMVLMVDNFLPAFDMEEQLKIDKKIDEQLAIIKRDIQDKKNEIEAVTEEDLAAHQGYIDRMAAIPVDVYKDMYQVNDDCIGCGICTKVCPAKCIEIIDGKPNYDYDNCQACMACIHHCPVKAIKLTSMPEKNPNARFINENIKLTEIIEANNQKNKK